LRGNLLPATHFRCVLACRASALAVGIGVATAIVGSALHRQTTDSAGVDAPATTAFLVGPIPHRSALPLSAGAVRAARQQGTRRRAH
jgi:hypothetical protein